MSHVLIHLIAAARPNFMKIAPVYHALKRESWCDVKIVHTGQHYDANMSRAFFSDLDLPEPHFHLGVGSGTHGEQTAGVVLAYERLCFQKRPDWIIVVGDVNSTAACALVGAKLCIPVAHLEAGLRSRDRSMPEEINRIVTDAIASLLWTPSSDADDNLRNEGIPAERINRVGNVMIDSYELLKEKIQSTNMRASFNLDARGYGVVTLHRPANVDNADVLSVLMEQLHLAAREIPLIFAVHPRTRRRLDEYRLQGQLPNADRLLMIPPLGYIQFMSLVQDARVIVTDSGGIQEEATYLDIPCLTVRDTTERPITISQGTNRLVQPHVLLQELKRVLDGDCQSGKCPEFWDGRTASRVVESLKRRIHREACARAGSSDKSE